MAWNREKSLNTIRDVGLVPIVRTAFPEDALRAAEAIIAGNIGIAEITMTVPNAIQVMEQVTERYGDRVLLGAGTILDAESCRAALLAGAQFIVTPSLNLHVIEMARRYSKPCFPGALTPTEVVTAWQAGADMVKIFPCGPVGGPQYIKALKGPFPQIEFIPTGGVNLETTPEFIKAGASAVAVGSELMDLKALREGKLEVITARARQFLEAVRSGRAGLAK
ncbi:MAG TPA: bifunctional 4-hydroxy-2-oxoglutarate aldolase/2-dehydro-3-deoxy-phosphogluconate aldolase [Terriglobia bacterium]|nr:bifunctional 4-hydroxy-2-oxoglutarate aldolase/2-dehydro-3-deoxy-phosphogluconate aldolase [Terriglobia bacterium]